MQKLAVRDARLVDAIGKQVRIQGWGRTRRDSKGGFSFIEVNDGTSLASLQIIADKSLPNYESEIQKLTAGCSVTIDGEIKASAGIKTYDAAYALVQAGATRIGTSAGVQIAQTGPKA